MSRQNILSNINTVAGSKAAKAKEAAKADPSVKAKQMEIAQRIARQQFEVAFPFLIRSNDPRKMVRNELSADEKELIENKRIRDIMITRQRRTITMIRDPRNADLYNMHMERNMLTNQNLRKVIDDIKQQLSAHSSSVLSVVKALRINTKNSFFGCDVHIGVCTDANAQTIEFIGEKDYWRREQKGRSAIFSCLEQRDVVVQSLVAKETKSLFGKRATPSRERQAEEIAEGKRGKATLGSGEAVVYVPLLGERGGMGVMEIHGLFSDGITDPRRYERKVNAVQAMMAKQDFRFIHEVRLWRRPGDRIKNSSIPLKDMHRYDRCDYYIVCGRIREVVFTRNGVPIPGGAHFLVVWEDKFTEEAVSQSELIKLYAQTPQSLGTSSELDLVLTDALLHLGKTAGALLEEQHTKDCMTMLKKKLYFPNLGEQETFERTLDTVLHVIRGIKEATISVWDEMTLEAVPLTCRFAPSILARDLKLSHTEVTTLSLESAEPFEPQQRLDAPLSGNEWITVELKMPNGYRHHGNQSRRRFFANMCRVSTLHAKAAAAEVLIFTQVLKTLSDCLEIAWQRDLRSRHRKELIKSIEGNLFSWRSLTIQDICHNTTQIVATIVPDADVYVGLLSEGAKTIKFLAATPGSQMVDQILARGSGVSYDSIENLETLIIQANDTNKRNFLKQGSAVQVYYGRKAFKGRIHKDRGHEKYDVEYLELDRKIEAGVDIKRIVPMHTAFRMKQLGGKMTMPYVCIPLRHREKGIGALGLDSLGNVPRAPYDPNPETGLQTFLEQIGRILGTTIDLQRKKQSLKSLNLVAKNVNSEMSHVLDATFDAIRSNLYYVDSIICGRVIYEVKDILVSGGAGIQVIKSWGDPEPEVKQRMETYHATRSNQKPVQAHGDRMVWMLLKLQGADRFTSGKIYIVAITQKGMPLTEPDLEYLAVLQKVLKSTVQSLDLKGQQGNTKDFALSEIRNICRRWKDYPREVLFNAVAEKVNQVYITANLYVGRLNAHGAFLNFFLASGRSKMKGKRLKREKKQDRVSLVAIDTATRLVVTPNMDRAQDLFHFGPPEGFEYPFVAIPLAAHIDGPVGVLCGDACEDPAADSEDTGDVLSFFGTVGMYLSDPIRGYSAEDAKVQLQQIAYDYPNLKQGMREIKRVILGIVPYAKRVAEVCYEPREVRSLAINELVGDDSAAMTTQDYVILVKVCHAMNRSRNYSNPIIVMTWMGSQVYKCNIRSNGKMNTKPFVLSVPKGIIKSKLQLQILLQGSLNGATKDISKKTLGLQYLSNVPLFNVDHILDSPSDPLVHVADVQIVSKMYNSSQIVTMNISAICLRGLAKADEFGLADPFISIKWNGVEVYKTTVMKNNLDPVWTGLGINLNLGALAPTACELVLDVWDQDMMGRGDFLGRIFLTGDNLVSLFTSIPGSGMAAADGVLTQDQWIDLQVNSKMSAASQEMVQGRCKISGSAVLALNLNEEQIHQELDIVSKLQSSADDSTADDDTDQSVYHECEVMVVAARGIKLPTTREFPNTFCVLKFNGDEIGRTGVVDSNDTPEWEEERFSIRSPGGDGLETCILVVELFHLDKQGKGELLGKVEVTGRPLVALLATSAGQKARWLDVTAPPAKKAANAYAQQEKYRGYGDFGQLMLAGHPLEVETSESDQVHAIDLGWMEVFVKSGHGHIERSRVLQSMSQFNAIKNGDRYTSEVVYFTKTKFNGTELNTSKPVTDSTDSLVWSRGHAAVTRFRRPNNRSLKDCVLAVELWAQVKCTVRRKKLKPGQEKSEEQLEKERKDDEPDPPILMSFTEITGQALLELLGQDGFKTRSIPLTVVSGKKKAEHDGRTSPILGGAAAMAAAHTSTIDNIPFVAEQVKLRCGPEGSNDLWDDDGREIWFDVLAATNLPRRRLDTYVNVFERNPTNYDPYTNGKSSPSCLVFWNDKLIGETPTLMDDCNPIWEDVRIIIRPPLIDNIADSLTKCKLTVKIYDNGPGAKKKTQFARVFKDENAKEEPKALLGYIDIEGEDLVAFLGKPTGQRKWFKIASDVRNDPNANDELPSPLGEIKLRAGPKGALDDVNAHQTLLYTKPLVAEECVITLLSASGLTKPDAFANSNSYVVVEYNQVAIFRSNEVKGTVNPEFMHNERFTFRFPAKALALGDMKKFDLTDSNKDFFTQCQKELSEMTSGNFGNHVELLINVWNHNIIPGQADEFLGCVTLRGEQLYKMLTMPDDDFTQREEDLVQTVHATLTKSDYLTPDENEYAGGKFTYRIDKRPRVPAIYSIEYWEPTVLWVQACKDIANTKMFGSGSDPYVKIFRKSRADGGEEKLLHTGRVIASTQDPEFIDELVVIDVPQESKEIVSLWKQRRHMEAEEERMKAEWAEAAAKAGKSKKGAPPPVMPAVLSKGDLSARRLSISSVNSAGGGGEVHQHGPLHESDLRWQGLQIRVEVWDKTTDDFLGCVTIQGEELRILLFKDDKTALEGSARKLARLPTNVKRYSPLLKQDLVRGSVVLAGGRKPYYDSNYISQRVKDTGRSTSRTARVEPGAEAVAKESKPKEPKVVVDEGGEEIIVNIHKALDLSKADGFLGKSDPFCIVKWNEREVGRSSVVMANLNPTWDDEKFKMNLPDLNKLPDDVGGVMEVKSDIEPLSYTSKLEIEIWDMDAVGAGDFLGMITLSGGDLANLLTFDAGEGTEDRQIEYPLGPSEALTPRGNKLAVKGSVFISAVYAKAARDAARIEKQQKEAKDKEIESNPALQSSRVEIFIKCAAKLPKMNMRGGCDPFVKVFWLNVDTDDSKPTSITQVVSNSTDPVFDNEIIQLEKPAGMRISECKLRLAFYNKGMTRDDFMGEITLSGEDIIAALPAQPSQDHATGLLGPRNEPPLKTYALGMSKILDPKLQKYASTAVAQKANVTFTIQQIGTELQGTDAKQGVCPAGMKEMEITVMSCSNLPKANTFGLSDPYCEVRWGSRLIGKTNTISDCLNPVYNGQTFQFRATEELGQPNEVKEAKAKAAYTKMFKKLQRKLSMAGQPATDADVTKYINDQKASEHAAPPQELVLIVDCYDWNAVAQGVFLGAVEISGEELNDFAAGGRHQVKWFDLKQTRRLKARDQTCISKHLEKLNRQADVEKEELEEEEDEEIKRDRMNEIMSKYPQVTLMLGPKINPAGGKAATGHSHHVENNDIVYLDLEVTAARGLAKADTFGSADPYVKVFWNNQQLGQTATKNNTLAPEWEDENFNMFFAAPYSLYDCVLYLEVWDGDTIGAGAFLGSLTLKGESLVKVVDMSRFYPIWYDLSATDMLPAAVQELVRGELEIRLGRSGALALANANAKKYEIEIFGATGLPRADGMFGLSDPYAIVKWNYHELGRTPYISKTLDPVWEENNTFHFFTDVNSDEGVGVNHLQVDIWDYDVIGNGNFLGCITATGEELELMFRSSTLSDEDKTFWFNLDHDPRSDRADGIVPKGKIEVRVRIPDESTGSLATAMNLKWESECDGAAGQPTLELGIISCNNLPATKILSGKCNPMCVVSWADEEIGSTPAGNNVTYEWIPARKFSLKLPQHAEVKNTNLKIDVWDTDSGFTVSKADHLGAVIIPFRGILRLQHGRFTFPLNQVSNMQYVRGSITLSLTFSYPYWDSIQPHEPHKLLRSITVISAKNLPAINGESPSSKAVVMIGGVVKARTLVSSRTGSPAWAQTDCALVVDTNKPTDAIILIYHVDLKLKKEIPIGQYAIPFELLIRPPIGSFDSSLVPVGKTTKNTKYKFDVGGNVRIQIHQDKSIYEAMSPWSSRIPNPDAALQVHDITPNVAGKSKQDIQYDGDILTLEERLWLGTVYDLTRVSTLPSRPRWIVMPIHDIGQRVGFKAVDLLGTRPGQRMALAVERDDSRLNTSDAELLTDIWTAVDHCIAQLRRKEIYRTMRELSLARFAQFLQSTAKKQESYDDEEVSRWINDAIQTCCPGVRTYTASVSSDLKSLKYTMFELNGSQRQFTIHQGQGSEWEFVGRHPPKSSVVRTAHDFQVRSIAAYRPLPNTNFPRFVVPLASGDVSLGFFGVENFDIHRGRPDEALTDEQEIRKWFEEIGTLCGDAMYTGREKRSLRDIESYTLGWGSSYDGVVLEILRTCMGVIQGCKLMEVWSIDKNNHIQSLSAAAPMSQPVPGRHVTIQQLKLKVLGGKGLKAILKSTASEEIDLENLLGGAPEVDESDGAPLEEASMTKAQVAAKKEAEAQRILDMENKTITFLLGLRYDNVEQTRVFKLKENDTRGTIDVNIPVIITHDRNINVSIYQVTPDLRILQDWSGRISFTSFAETSLTTSLSAFKAFSSNFECEFTTVWPNIAAGEVKRIDIDLKQLKLFNIIIKSARDLKPCDGDTSDPFCEVFYGEEMIGKTAPQNKTLNPVFEESFIIAFGGKREPLIVDMYDMSMFGKGSFLGRVELPFDLLCTPPPGDFEYPLKMKPKLNAKKQEKVGGMLTIEYSIEMKKAENNVDMKAAAAVDLNSLEIPRNVWGMKIPALNLTINASTNLAKANLFGGGSDPFVVVYLDYKKKESDEPVFKTKFIDNNLNPIWNETFVVNLGVNMEQGVTTAKDFPTIRLEVYDYNRLIKGAFLGGCEIGPAVYFQRKGGEFKLQPAKKLNASKNKLVQGDLSATFYLQDNVVGSNNSVENFKWSNLGTLYGQTVCEVHVIKAKGLMAAKRMSGKSDPYVVIRWSGADYGETSCKNGTLEPVWTNEKFIVPVADAGSTIPNLTIEVWDRDFFTGGSFMGEVVITGEQLLHPASSDNVEAPLTAKPDEPNPKIKGHLTYRLVSNRLAQRLKFTSKDFIEVKAQKASAFTAQDIRIIKDPDAEQKRQQFEKLNLPGIIKKARQDMDNYSARPFERTGLISELHFGQVISACTRATHTVLKTDVSDVFVLPINRASAQENMGTGSPKKPKLGEEPPPEAEREPILCMVARYDTGKLPRRDIQYMQKFQDVLMRGLKISTKREGRQILRAALEKNMTFMQNNTDICIANDTIISGIVEIEQGLGCNMDIFALMPDGKTLYECTRTRGDADYNSNKANDFVQLAARLCRHGIMIQNFRGQFSLVDWEWMGVSQMALIDIDTVAEAIDTIEGDGFVQSLKEQGKYFAPDGTLIFPLMEIGDPVLAVGQVHNLDNLPYASYRVKAMEARRKVKAAPDSTKRKKKEYEEIFGPEHGVVAALRTSAQALGACLIYGRLNDCVKKMKNFEITPRTTMSDILSNMFRLIAVAIPAVRRISLWGVDFAKLSSISTGKAPAKRKNFIDQLKEMLGLAPKKTEDIEPQPPTDNNDFEGFPEVVCGYFGDEAVDSILAAHLAAMLGNTKIIEKKRFTKDADGNSIIQTTKIEKREKTRRSSNINHNVLAERNKNNLEKKDEVGKWTVSIPVAMQLPPKVEKDEALAVAPEKTEIPSPKSRSSSFVKKTETSESSESKASSPKSRNSSFVRGRPSIVSESADSKNSLLKPRNSSFVQAKSGAAGTGAASTPPEPSSPKPGRKGQDDSDESGSEDNFDMGAMSMPKDTSVSKISPLLGMSQADAKSVSAAGGIAANQARDAEEYRTDILDVSLYSSVNVERVFGVVDRNLMALTHAECLRCINVLKKKAFSVSTGHLLCSVGNDEESRSHINSMFGIKDEFTVLEEERIKKERELAEKEKYKTDTMRELDVTQRMIADANQVYLDEQDAERAAKLIAEADALRKLKAPIVITEEGEEEEEEEEGGENEEKDKPKAPGGLLIPHISPRGQGVIGVAGTSNVKPMKTHDSEGNIIMDPKRPKAPLPPGPAPAALSPRGAPTGSAAALAALAKLKEKENLLKVKVDEINENRLKRENKERAGALGLDEEDAAIEEDAEKLKETNKYKQPKLQFFLGISSNGTGGDDGWGELGRAVSEGLVNIGKELDVTVGRMTKFKKFVEKEAKEREARAELKRQEEEAAAEALRKKEREEKEEKRRQRESKRQKSKSSNDSDGGNSSDSSAGSPDKKVKRRASIARRASQGGEKRRASASRK